MLAKNRRLDRAEVTLLKDSSRKNRLIQGSFFGLVFQENNKESKFGVIISNKISSKAVERNRIKRLLYQAVKEKMMGKTGYFLFLAKKSCLGANLESFKKEMEDFNV
jgi:ribonuclease P protein component